MRRQLLADAIILLKCPFDASRGIQRAGTYKRTAVPVVPDNRQRTLASQTFRFLIATFRHSLRAVDITAYPQCVIPRYGKLSAAAVSLERNGYFPRFLFQAGAHKRHDGQRLSQHQRRGAGKSVQANRLVDDLRRIDESQRNLFVPDQSSQNVFHDLFPFISFGRER